MKIRGNKIVALSLLLISILLLAVIIYLYVWSRSPDMLSRKLVWLDYSSIFHHPETVSAIIFFSMSLLLVLSIYVNGRVLMWLNLLVIAGCYVFFEKINFYPF